MSEGLVGLTPVKGKGFSQALSASSTAAVTLPTQAGGINAPTDGGTSTFPNRYPTSIMMTALSANGWIRFGDSTVGTATNTTGGFDLFLPTGIPVLYTRSPGDTSFRVIGDGTGTIQMSMMGFNETSIT